jgi:hypothetical protein
MVKRKIAGSFTTALVVVTYLSGLPGPGEAAQASPITGCGTSATASSAESVSPDPPLTPEEIMARRFPQPVRVGHLIGLPVFDESDQTFGRIEAVMRTDQDKIRLIVPFGGWFGWGARPVAVPIETVAILGMHVNALEFTRQDFETAVTWAPGSDRPLGENETITIALGRR